MSPRKYGDAGQAFPIYITVVGSLLFLAFAYFAVGQAAVNRNGAQTAADAAALAAAQDRRDVLAGAWVQNLLDPNKWRDIFEGNDGAGGSSCGRAHQLAAQNDARVVNCTEGLLRITVEVETNKSVGDSIIPGTEERKSNAFATAVIDSRCDFKPPAADPGEKALPRLSCKGVDWDLKPDSPPEILPKPEDLFDVHLAD
ncbi:pilus assembly protein TadG-related protein [Streptomyces sp. NPDC057838]|uniref:pilus assembly protein TadG-related protein n=1 Tax=unclassified Streptomyces TaxID=2593676 RepID=UPI00368BA17E